MQFFINQLDCDIMTTGLLITLQYFSHRMVPFVFLLTRTFAPSLSSSLTVLGKECPHGLEISYDSVEKIKLSK